MLLKRWTFGGKRAEHEAAIGLHAYDAAKPQLRLVGAFVPVRKGVTDETAIIGESPGMEGTSKGSRVALIIGADLVTPMRTSVEQQVDLPLLVSRHDDGLRADRFGHVVIGVRNLALMPDIDPGAIPDALQLGLEDRGIAV